MTRYYVMIGQIVMWPSNTQQYFVVHLPLVLIATGATWRATWVSGYVVTRKWSRVQALSIGQRALGWLDVERNIQLIDIHMI